MNTELKNAVKAADLKAQYDARVKRLVGHKRVLAQILIKTVDEFKGMNPKTVANCIEGTPYIGTVPVEPGLTNIVMIGLARELPEHDETYELHRLLGALLSQELSVDEKLNIIGNEYNIPIEENMRKDVSAMCNLGEGIEEKGIAKGREAGREEGRIEGEASLILKMHKNGLSAEQIASATDKTIEEVEAIISGKNIDTGLE